MNSQLYFSTKNHWVNSSKYDGLLFIGNTNSFLRLSPLYKELIDNKKFDDLPKELYEELIRTGALTQSDEQLFSKYQLLSMKKNNSGYMDFWINIADCCNFECSYCFQGKEKGTKIISTKILDKFVQSLSTYKDLKFLRINFAGGEPLLATDKIIYLYKKIKENITAKLEFSIITNGYLLTDENIKKLDMIENLLYQVTIDGLGQTHNKKRPHKTDKDSFNVIMHNLNYFYETHKNQNISFTIRTNVDKETAKTVSSLYHLLKSNYGDFYNYQISPVEEYSKNICVSNVFTNEEYADFLIDLYEKEGIYLPLSYFPRYYSAGGFCQADRNYSFALTSTGDLLKCPMDVGKPERVVKNILTPTSTYNFQPEYDYLIKCSPYSNEKCKHCKLFYQCLGGCPHRRLEGFSNCPPPYYRLDKFLEICYENMSTKVNKK